MLSVRAWLRQLSASTADRRGLIQHGSIVKALLFLSSPTILMTIVSSMITLSDGLFLNNTASNAVAGAIGFAASIINTVNSLSLGLGIAARSMIGQLYGQGAISKVKHVQSQVMVYSFLLGVALAPFLVLIAFILSKYVNPEVAGPLFNYLSLYAFVIPFLFMAAIFNALKDSVGRPEATFTRMIFLFILKLIFNSIFLSYLRWNEFGAVLSSFCSYFILGIWMFYDLYIVVSEDQLDIHDIKPDKIVLGSLFKIGVPSMLNQALVYFGLFLISMDVESFGPVTLNAQAIASNVNSLCFNLPASIATTVTTMVAINIGIEQEKRAKQICIKACLISLVTSVIICLIFIPNSTFFIRFFRDDPEILEVAGRALDIYTWSIIPFGIFCVVQAVFVALGRTKVPLFAGVLRIWLIRYIFIRIFIKKMGVDAVFYGNLVSNYLAAIIIVIMLLFTPWHSIISDDLERIKGEG